MPSSSSLSGLMKWLGRPEWSEAFQEVLRSHMGPACDAVGIDQDDIEDVLGEGYAMTLWGCAFEDVLTSTLEPDGRNIIDEYLKRRGWKETATNRRYMQALRGSVMSLYQVSGIVLGEAFMARDLLRGGEPVRVSERTASRSLAQWERIGARVVALNGTYVIAGGLLPFTQEASDEVVRAFGTGKRRARRKTAPPTGTATNPGEALQPSSAASRLNLQDAAPVFTGLWLADVLPRVLDPRLPTILNTEGHAVSFHTVRYPFLAGTRTEQVHERLNSVETLNDAGHAIWNWIEDDGTDVAHHGNPPPRDAELTFGVTMGDGGVVSGTVAIVEGAVVLSTNSAARAERGHDLLTPLLDGLVGAPLTEVQSVERMMADRRGRDPAPVEDIPPDVLAEIVHESLDRHYRATLDNPISMLGGKTPRACARTKAGRDKVVDWLKSLERNSGRVGRDEADPMRSYDFGWMWDELGVIDLRR